jgi:hypothetical protein
MFVNPASVEQPDTDDSTGLEPDLSIVKVEPSIGMMENFAIGVVDDSLDASSSQHQYQDASSSSQHQYQFPRQPGDEEDEHAAGGGPVDEDEEGAWGDEGDQHPPGDEDEDDDQKAWYVNTVTGE